MKFTYLAHLDKRKSAEVLVIPFWKGKKLAEWAAAIPSSIKKACENALQSGDFKGNEGEIMTLYFSDTEERRVCLIGLGVSEKVSTEVLRRSYGTFTKYCLSRKIKTVNLVVPTIKKLPDEDAIRGIAEGVLLPNYSVERFKMPDPEDQGNPYLLNHVTWISSHKNTLNIAEKALIICEAVYYARDLVNGNADDITPQFLESSAKEMAKDNPAVKVTLFDKKRIQKEKMGLLLAVNRGSLLDPAFIILTYHGNPKSKDHTVLVGKGVTYDTGGLNIKTVGMEQMKCDMGGAAACMGVMLATCKLKLPVNLTVVIPATENCVDAKSYKPGDVYSSYLGKSVEITNTDAEGRLILADALAYAVKHLNPTRMIDVATLTGAMDICFGPEATGLMSNNELLSQALVLAGNKTHERVWPLPIFDEYRDRLKSDIADLKNRESRTAGSSVAAAFLQEFVGEKPWAHLDIASTAFITETKKYLPKYATGVGVRLLVEYLESLKK